jgi:hypothetical protein
MFLVYSVKYSIFLSDLNYTWILPIIFIKAPSIKFYRNPSNGSGEDEQTDGLDEANRGVSR